jgi:class 3 adenylate cyclase/predicted ATPase
LDAKAVDVAAWLRDVGLERYEQAFLEHDIRADVLADLTETDLEKLGVSLGDRKRFLKAIAALQVASSTESPRSDQVAASAPPAFAAREAERRQLTVLFCDLVGSTELSARLDPEEMREVIGAYQANVAEVVRRWDGYVARYMGDGALAYFGWPRAHEDDPERAVRAGLELVQTVAALRPAASSALQARVGIATGHVVVGDLGTQEASDKDSVVGETPNLAARLQSFAEPGSVVISHATRRLVGGLFELHDLGPRPLKGFAERLAVWRVSGESKAEGRFEARHTTGLTPLVGRDEELSLLLRRWAQASDGEGQVVLLSGEPGIGKSRIVRALRERLGNEPYTPLSHYCSPFHVNSALHPVIGLLERSAGFARDDPPDVKLTKLENLLSLSTDDLDVVVPLVAALLGVTEEKYPPLALTPQRQRQRTLEVLVDQVEGLARREPVLATYEDLHWADPTTLEIVDLVVERVQRMPVLVLITLRPEFAPPWTGHAHVTQLSLSRLTRRHGSALIEQVTGGKALPAEVLDQILARTDGVPLFVEELTKSVLESGLLRDAGDRFELDGPLPSLAIPSSLHDSLMARLDRLAPVKEVAQIGAVIGREFSHELLVAVADRPETELTFALGRLIASELIFRRGTPPEATYIFKHVLVQDAAYESLLKSRRQQLHMRVAAILADRFPETVKLQPEVLALHCTEAGRAEEAISYWYRAGQRANERSAYHEAIAHLSRALELLDQVTDPAARTGWEASLRMTLGVVMYASRGPVDQARSMYLRARELCEEIGDEQQLFVAVWGLWHIESMRMNAAAARHLADEVLKLAGRQDSHELLLQAHHAGWTTSFYQGEIRNCKEHAERGVAIYDADIHHRQISTYGAHDAGVCSLVHGGLALWLLGYSDRAAGRAEQALRLAEQLLHPFSLAQALFACAAIQQFRGAIAEVRKFAGRLVITADDRGIAIYRETGTALDGWARAVGGETGSGIADIGRSLEALRAMGFNLRRSYFLWLLADACGRASDYERGLAALAEALAFVDERAERWWEAELHRVHGELLLRSSAPDQARAAASFERALDFARKQEARSLELRAATSLARLRAEQGERHKAYDLLASVYSWFTEGFDTADLKDAKALLEELA